MASSESTSTKPMRQRVEEYIVELQETIVQAFESLDPNGGSFKRDSWIRAQGGRGQSCVFPPHTSPTTISSVKKQDVGSIPPPKPSILEKAGVNISVVHGTLPPPAIKQMKADHSSLPILTDPTKSLPFFAAGLSLVIHPRNPHAPTVHANYRYFEVCDPDQEEEGEEEGKTGQGKVVAWWFGGGSDLTPSYLYEEDAKHFHGVLKEACTKHVSLTDTDDTTTAPSSLIYEPFKKWCDQYFFIPHRGESRGIGGIFFDDLCDVPHSHIPGETERGSPHPGRPHTPASIFAFIKSTGDAFVPSYLPILERRHGQLPSLGFHPSLKLSEEADEEVVAERERRWQLLRRGRYVEFNLVYDRGTKFGLATPGARIESILMSLPETARWEYMSEMGAEEGSREEELIKVLKNPRDWV